MLAPSFLLTLASASTLARPRRGLLPRGLAVRGGSTASARRCLIRPGGGGLAAAFPRESFLSVAEESPVAAQRPAAKRLAAALPREPVRPQRDAGDVARYSGAGLALLDSVRHYAYPERVIEAAGAKTSDVCAVFVRAKGTWRTGLTVLLLADTDCISTAALSLSGREPNFVLSFVAPTLATQVLVSHGRTSGRAEVLPGDPGFAKLFKRTTPASRRRRNQ